MGLSFQREKRTVISSVLGQLQRHGQGNHVDSCRQPRTCPRAHLPLPPVLSAQAGTIVMLVAAYDNHHMTARHAPPPEDPWSARLLVTPFDLGNSQALSCFPIF